MPKTIVCPCRWMRDCILEEVETIDDLKKFKTYIEENAKEFKIEEEHVRWAQELTTQDINSLKDSHNGLLAIPTHRRIDG